MGARRWSAADLHDLGVLWGVLPLRQLSRRLGRPEAAVQRRAEDLGLRFRPAGLESVKAAARRAGLSPRLLVRELRAAGVRIVRPGRAKRYVRPEDVDVVVAAWVHRETPRQAAQRLGVCGETVRRALAASAVPRGRGGWRCEPQVVDQAVSRRRRRRGCETP